MRFLFAFLFSSLSLVTIAQSNVSHFFVEVNVNNEGSDSLTFGTFEYEENFDITKNKWKGIHNAGSFMDSLDVQLNALPKDKRNILFYIHGMWGHKWAYLKHNQKSMQKNMWTPSDFDYGIVITYIWNCNVKYESNKAMAIQSGKILLPISENIHKRCIASNEKAKFSYLLHSMGSRVFESIWSSELKDNVDYRAEHIIFAGPDLETNTFQEGEPLADIENFADHVTVYVHNTDRTLGISKMINGIDRLGLEGIVNMDSISSIIRQVDVSVIQDNEDLPSRVSNHRYFYASPTVRKDLVLILKGEDPLEIPRRETLDHERKQVLRMFAEK